MTRPLIRDSRNAVPNYVMYKGDLIHQPTGLSVPLPTPALDSEISAAMTAQINIVNEHTDEHNAKTL